MRKLLNTLYITTPESYIHKDGQSVVISINQNEVFRIPIINIEGIVTFGYMGASPGVMKLCAESGVSLTFLSPSGRFVSRVQGATKGNVLLRVAQYRFADNEEVSLHLSKLFIGGKIQNYRNILRRWIRDNGDNAAIYNAANHLENSKRKIRFAASHNELRGLEGDAAGSYFGVFSEMILHQKEDFIFKGRNRRPALDAVNTLLSFVYTLIANDVAAALETVGLDPYVGFLHTLRPGRTSLALDVMEELRAYLGDRLVLSLINRRQITIRDFIYQGESGVLLSDNGRKVVLCAWQNRKKELITHPYLQERIPIGLLPYAQSVLLARYLRNELDDYPVFILR
ncbi:MAG: type I-C CRISPR-associated endonuclease Cas1c [Rikenellaceae bacterium]